MTANFSFRFASLLLLALLPLLTQCREDNYVEPPIDYLPQEFKNWMFFKEGTYWIYQDSVTGALDSTVVTGTETYIDIFKGIDKKDKDEDRIIKKNEVLTYTTYSYLTGHEYYYTSTDRCMVPQPDYENKDCLSVNRARKRGNQYSDITELLFYNMPVGYSSTYISVRARYDSLQVGSRYFKDVVYNWQAAHDNDTGVARQFYLAKGIGIVKLSQFYNGAFSTQKLIRYHIVQ